MRIAIIIAHDHFASKFGWFNLAFQFKKILKESFKDSVIEVLRIPYTSFFSSSYYFYSYKDVDLKAKFDHILVCEGKPPKKWRSNGNVIWIPCQEFLSGGPWNLICDKTQDWYSLILPSKRSYDRITSVNDKIECQHMQIWTDLSIEWKEIKKTDNLRMFFNFRTRNFGNQYNEQLFRKLNARFDNIDYTLKIDDHANIDLRNIDLKNVKRIMSGMIDDPKIYQSSLAESDIYVAPRIVEGIGLCSQEAAAAGNVLVGPDCSTFNEYFSNDNGMLLDCETEEYSTEKLILGERKRHYFKFSNQDKLVEYVDHLIKNKEKLRAIQRHNHEYAKFKYHEFRENFTKYITDRQSRISVKPRKRKIAHLQFCLEGGQGLISTLITTDLQKRDVDNVFYHLSSNERQSALGSYLARLNGCGVPNKHADCPEEIDLVGVDILFVHWCSVAPKQTDTALWYPWIKNLGIKTVGLIYDSVDVMPEICDHYCVASKFNAKFIPFNAKGSYLIPYQVEGFFYRDSQNMDCKNSPFVIGRASRLIERKFHKRYWPICRYLSGVNEGMSVHVLGDGPFREEVENQFNKYGVQFKITGDEYGAKRSDLMSSADICLYLTGEHEESFGLVVAEYLALGVPVVCENKGALKEVVSNAGLVCDNLHQVIDGCERLMRDRDLRNELSRRSRDKAKEYSSESVVAKYLEMIDEILREPRLIREYQNPRWSLIMPTHDCADYIETAIASVRDQFHDSWELIIIDDGSTDKTWEIAQRFQTDKRIRYHRFDGPTSQSACWNRGLRLAKGELVGFIDADDWLCPSALAEMEECYQDEKVVMAWSNNEHWDVDFKNKLYDGFSEDPYKQHGSLIDGMIRGRVVVSHFLTVRRNVVDFEIDETIKTSADRWLALRMDLVGKLRFLNKILYRYRFLRPGSTTVEDRDLQIMILERILNDALEVREDVRRVQLIKKENGFDYEINVK